MASFLIKGIRNRLKPLYKALLCVTSIFIVNASEAGGIKTQKMISVGGQALIEGMLMIGPRKVAIAIRKPDNEIELKINPISPKIAIQKIPLIRGAVNLFKQMKIGVGALMYSAQYMEIEEDNVNTTDSAGGNAEESGNGDVSANESKKSVADGGQSRFERFLDEKFGDKAKDIIIYLAVVISLCFSVGLFILLPNFVAGFLPLNKTQKSGLILSNLLEGCIRVSLFLTYLALTARLQEISRLWQYHGAEHKTIHCYEHGDPVIVGNVRKYPIKHPRCGTSFLFLVMIISILVFSLVDLAVFNLKIQLTGVFRVLFSLLIRIVAIPLVAGAAYEVIKVSGRYDNPITRVISAPGVFFQRFTTKEPDDGMIEGAITAFENAL
jgi:uncharacterized protein YqhQ